jgi:hypothetical protein
MKSKITSLLTLSKDIIINIIIIIYTFLIKLIPKINTSLISDVEFC